MKTIISIIIPEFQDEQYFIRCLNSIEKQTFKDYEIIILNNICKKEIIQQYNLKLLNNSDMDVLGKINSAIKKAKGDYIFFCSGTSVLANDVLERLLSSIIAKNILVAANILTLQENSIEPRPQMMMLYGKLLQKSIILRTELIIKIEGFLEEVQFILNYTEVVERIELIEDAYIYEIEEPIELKGRAVESTEVKKIIKSCAKFYRSTWFDFEWIQNVLISAIENVEEETEKIQLATLIGVTFFERYEMNYIIANRVLCSVYYRCLSEKLTEEYIAFQEYFELFRNDENYIRFCFSIFRMNKEQLHLFIENELDNYIFLSEEIEKVRNLEEKTEVENILERIEAIDIENILKRIDELEKKGIFVEQKESVLEGAELAEITIDKYRQGSLGLKTLIKSFWAWLRYKV